MTTGDYGRAVGLCEQAESRLADAKAADAIASAGRAKDLVRDFDNEGPASTFIRAAIAQVDGYNLLGRVVEARRTAGEAVRHATSHVPGGRWEILSRIKLAESYETGLEYIEAKRQFVILLRSIPDEVWCADLKMDCANHALSIATHNCDPFLGEFGRRLGRPLRPLVASPDTVSAFLQWDGLHLNRIGEIDEGCRIIRESYELRAETERRIATRSALEAELAFHEDGDEAGAAAAAKAKNILERAGLVRHAKALGRHLARFFR